MDVLIDYETRSKTDLTKSGGWRYAACPSTDILVLGVQAVGHEPAVWIPEWVRGKLPDSIPYSISDAALARILKDASKIIAYNIEFEIAISHEILHKRYGFPKIDISKCDCLAARAAVLALPRRLEDVANIMLPDGFKKDMEGHRLMLKMCKPRKPRQAERAVCPEWENKDWWHETPEQLKRLIEYARQDAVAECKLHEVLPPLSKTERQALMHTIAVNMRGVPLDIDSVLGLTWALDEYERERLNRMSDITGGRVCSPRQVKATLEWMDSRGVKLENMQKDTVSKALAGDQLPPDVREVLSIRQTLAKSSVSKYARMLAMSGEDKRARGTLMHHGASTGRATGKGVQFLNMPRNTYAGEQAESILRLFRDKDTELLSLIAGDIFGAASRCIRPVVCAQPGRKFYCADYASVEGVGVAWLAGDESKLDVFRAQNDGTGPKIYNITAGKLFGVPPEDIKPASKEYQVGKVLELSMGYGGGIGAGVSMAKGYSVDLESIPPLVMHLATNDDLNGDYGAYALAKRYLTMNPDAEISFEAAVAFDVLKRKWREDNAAICALWEGLETAATCAVTNPREIYHYRKIAYMYDAPFLMCKLPSGRILYYYDADVRSVSTDFGTKKTLTHYTVDTGRWVRRHTYGGMLAENVTQAICRDILTNAMHVVEDKGYPVIMHVYDEVLSEVERGHGSLDEFISFMETKPDWCVDFPLKASGWEGKRYRK